jgi:hypothetical protein
MSEGERDLGETDKTESLKNRTVPINNDEERFRK